MSLEVFPWPWLLFWVALPIVVGLFLCGLDVYKAFQRKRKGETPHAKKI